MGSWKDDSLIELKKAKKFSKKYDCILVAPGANTITIYKNKGFVKPTRATRGWLTAGSVIVLPVLLVDL